MSSQKGNVSRSRAQKHQNSTAFRNDKYGATVQVKKAKSKSHDGLCQHCKDVLEWKVKYNKYKPITQARKCVKCSQKTVKDAYHIVCKPCSLQLEICCKCGKKEEIVIPVNSEVKKSEQEQDGEQRKQGRGQRSKNKDDLDSDDDDDEDEVSDLGDDDDDEDDDEDEDKGLDCNHDSDPKKTQKTSEGLPDVSRVNVKD